MNSALMMFIVIGGVGGLANAFVNNYALFCVCRFVAAMGLKIWIISRKPNQILTQCLSLHKSGHTGLFLVPFTTSVELVGTKMVTFWSNMSHVPFALGQFVVIMIAYAERDWKMFQVRNQLKNPKGNNLTVGVSPYISDLLFGADFLSPASFLHHSRISSLAHREQTIQRGGGRCREGY